MRSGAVDASEGLLEFDDSPLLRESLHEDRYDVWAYFDDGAYPAHRAHKNEAEQRVMEFLARWDEGDLVQALARNKLHLAEWVPERLQAARSEGEFARLAAFAELQWLVEDSRAALRLDALNPPRDDQPLARSLPELYATLSRDGLYRISAENVTDAGGSLAVFRHGDHALYPHPHLRPLRELLSLLSELACDPRLEVWLALDPYRLGALKDVSSALLADRWSGIELTAANLDALDRHAVGVTSFHVPVNRPKVLDFFHPLVATSFDWAARRDDPDDPVKRLYIREYCPATNGSGDPLVAVCNRELHAERDTRARAFRHVDGKVRRYPARTYGIDHAHPRGDAGPHSHSRKLWRVDGPMTDDQWSELVGLHFRNNELVPEHFRLVFPRMGGAPELSS